MQLFEKNCLGYKSQREDHIMIKLIHRIDLATLFKVVQGQGHKVKVEYEICENLIGL